MQPSLISRALFIPAFLILACTGCATHPPSETDRKDIVLTNGWRFIRQDVPSAQSPNFDDAGWQAVTLPHTWNAVDGQTTSQNYYRGAGWYRLDLVVNPADADKELFLRFEAASLVADVFVNGQSAGHHVGGFAAFCFDITRLVHPGNNLLAVRVDNSKNPDIPPISGDFTICGGLYRNVQLLALNKVHISPVDDASPGVYLTPAHIDGTVATVNARTLLRNDLDTDQKFDIEYTVMERHTDRVVFTSGLVPQVIAAHSSATNEEMITLNHPQLWDGLAHPNLYFVTVDLFQNGALLDRVTQPLGLRTFRVDSQAGFFLNDRSYPLRGVAVHQDFANKGWAEAPADIDESYQLIHEIGANTVRLAHYQHPEYEYALCDGAGIVVWAEACLVNRVGDSPAFDENAKQQVRELIKQNYNHPSICFWSLFNELGPRTRTDWHLVHELNDIAHNLDPSRLTVAASHLPAEIPLNGYPDLIGFNRYFGWYTSTIYDWPTELDKLRAALPDDSIGISEYGAGASISQHEQPTTQPSTKGHWHPEDWQSQVHEAAWRAIKTRPWLWTTYVWCMFDFTAAGRDEGDTPGLNDKGLVTADRKIRKDAFYFYKANWSGEPFVHICDKRFSPRPAGPTQIKVYSNCQSTELFVNGRSQGKRSSSDHVFVWEQVPLQAGTCDVRAVGDRAEDQCTWSITAPATRTTGGSG